MQNLTRNRISCLQIINTACDIIPSRARRTVKDSSILFSTVRPDQLHFGIISKPQNNLLVSTGFAVIDVNTTVVNPYYVYIFLMQAGIIAKLQNIAENSTSAYPSITPNDIMELEIDLPSINEQSRIANIFQSIDRKISINATINDNLEQQLKCIYEYEFIQNADKAWRTVVLTDIAQLYQPQTISSKDLIPNGSYYVYGANGIIGKYNLFNHKDCEIAVACRGVCGAVTMTLPNSWITGNAMVVSPKKLFPYKEFLYYTLLKKNIAYLASGSVQSQLTRENMSIYPVVLPPLDKLSKFEQLAKCFRNKMIQLSYENKKLIRMRDWLLPMLMNGQATIEA